MATTGDIAKHRSSQLATPAPTASLDGRTYIVTGANTGLGLALATHLARLNAARVILAVRDMAKGNTARETIMQETQFAGVLEVWELDMARFASVAQFARKAEATLDRLDGAALNAGVATHGWHTTSDGWETTSMRCRPDSWRYFLLPLLQKTARLGELPNSDHIPPHLTITGSGGQNVAKFQERFEENILEALNDEPKFNSFDRYPTSKLFNYFIAKKVATLARAQGITVNALVQLLAWPASKGALNILYGLLAATPSGAYISRTRMQTTASWLDTEHGEQVRDRAWAEMVAVWEAEVPQANIRDIVDA
ncbi:hypothetical protein B0H14DRAFT_3619832 [Mycena olivaceomarginata]|nr:hypothetical protein B0H14DRAFT_3619832 [Mycena olivaceomarginata]